MTSKLAISAYPDHESAVDVISHLVHQGLSEVDIAVLSNEEQDRGWDFEPMAGDGAGRQAGRAAWLRRQGASSAVAEACAAAAEAGQAVLAVRCNEANVANVTRVLEEGPHAERLEDGSRRPGTGAGSVPLTATEAGAPSATATGGTVPAAGTALGTVHIFDRAT